MEENKNVNSKPNIDNNFGQIVSSVQKKRSNKWILIIIIVIGLVLVGMGVYKRSIEKEPSKQINEKDNNKPTQRTEDNLITKLEKHILKNGESLTFSTYSTNSEIKDLVILNDGVLKYKFNDSSDFKFLESTNTCYENDKYIEECGIIYETNKFIMIKSAGYIMINKDGNKITVFEKDEDDNSHGILFDLHLENGKLVAKKAYNTNRVDGKVEFVFTENEMYTVEIPNDNSQNKNSDAVLDLSQLSAKQFKVRDFKPEKLDTIQNEKKFDLIGTDENSGTLTVNIDGTKAILKYKSNKKSITKEINDVSKVFYSDYGNCSPHTLVYVLTSSKIYLVNINDYLDSYEERLNESNFAKEISNSNNYVDIYMDYLHSATCDFIPLWLGRTADGKYYDLDTSTEYKEGTYFYYDGGNNYVDNNKSYKLGKSSGTIKMAFIHELFDESLAAFIDSDDYLYEYDYDNGYNKTSKSKVVKIEKNDNNYDITFSNGDSRRISDLEAYK